MKQVFTLLVLLPFICFAQHGTKGIWFETTSWEEVKQKAKKENKFIFVDAYTTWCGPCKVMSNTIFPKPEVGDFFNKHFVNVMVQIDSTAKDNADVKKWYATARKIQSDYKVNAFPTYLFFDPNGKLVHRAIGSSDAKSFIDRAGAALHPETQYYTLLDRFNNNEMQPSELGKFAKAASSIYDEETLKRVATQYLKSPPAKLTPENIELVEAVTETPNDKTFALIVANPDLYDSLLKRPGAARQKIEGIVLYMEILPALYMAENPDFIKLENALSLKYPNYAKELTLKGKVLLYQQKKVWDKFTPAVLDYLQQYGQHVEDYELNELAWTVFENSTDTAALTAMLPWSKRSFEKDNDPMHIDTYANLLYKLGRTAEAIMWQKKAIELSAGGDKEDFEATLKKMMTGEKTWK